MRYYLAPIPYSSDPLDIDHMSNNVAFAPVYSGLVSDFQRGSYQGVLAESWTASPDHRIWSFTMRRGIRFEDGTEVDAGHVIAAWKRLGKLKRQRGSFGGFLDRLEGFDRPGPGGEVSGLSHDGRSISLRFREPYPNLLAALSETVNSVVPSSCFDEKSGEWRCTRTAPSSGPYRVVRWDADEVELALRTDFPAEFRHPKAPARFVLSGRFHSGEADLIFGASDQGPSSRGYSFHGGMESGIAFAYCRAWARPGGVCREPSARRAIRNAFAQAMRARGGNVARSFFPVAVLGGAVGPRGRETSSAADLKARTVAFNALGTKDRPSHVDVSLAAALAAVGGRPVEVGLSAQEWNEHLEPMLPNPKADIVFVATEVTPDQSESSVRFMFLSKEGIRLPDPTGRIRKELAAERLDFRRIDDLLYDDALVWPYRHFAWGTWALPTVDMSRVNIALPNPRLQWVGWRNAGFQR